MIQHSNGTALARTSPVLVVSGSIHFDVVVQLPRLPRENDRLTPQAMTLAPGGMGGNVAAAFSRLGGESRFAGAFTDDVEGEALRDDLVRDGVDTRWALTRPGHDYRGFILVGESGARAILGGWPQLGRLERASGQNPGAVQRFDNHPWRLADMQDAGQTWIDPHVFENPVAGFSCPFNYGPLMLPHVPESIPVFMDLETGHIAGWPNDDVWTGLRRARVLFGNQRNLAALASTLGAPDVTALSGLVPAAIVETTGPDGCVIHVDGMAAVVPGHPVEAVDTTGAGDCFAAAFTLSCLRGNGLVESAAFANVAAAFSTRQLGSRAGVPTAAEMIALTTAVPGISTAIELEAIVQP